MSIGFWHIFCCSHQRDYTAVGVASKIGRTVFRGPHATDASISDSACVTPVFVETPISEGASGNRLPHVLVFGVVKHVWVAFGVRV